MTHPQHLRRPVDNIDDRKPVVSKRLALFVGAIAMPLGIFLAVDGLHMLFHSLGKLIVFVIAAYAAGAVTHVWRTRAWEGGFTGPKLIRAALWPIGYLQKTWRTSVMAADTTTGPKLCSEPAARVTTYVATAAAGILLIVGCLMALSALGTLIELALIGYFIGLLVQFWVTSAWEHGLTGSDIAHLARWPIGALPLVRAGSNQAKVITTKALSRRS